MNDSLVIVTGMAGAGRTSCLRMLEDRGFEAVDNLPIPLMERLLESDSKLHFKLAIGVDSRTREFTPRRLLTLIRSLQLRPDMVVRLLYLDCDDETLRRRFTETRRRHPLAADRPVLDGIVHERALLAPLRDDADLVIDTTQMSLPELRRMIDCHFGQDEHPGLTTTVMSFSYRRGLPREADLVFDVRFLRNPYYDDNLRPMTGLDDPVRDYVLKDAAFSDFFTNLVGLVEPLLPRFEAEGKSYLTIAIGCTGGQHRSVFVSEQLALRLREKNWNILTMHRELAARTG